MRSLLLTRNFPPVLGGMERLNRHIALALAAAGPAGLVAPHGAATAVPAGLPVWEVPLQPLWRFGLAACWSTLRAARRLRPDWVVAGSGLVAPMALLAARAAGARLAVYVHGLDLVAPSALYRGVWLRCIRHADRVLANSRHTAALAREAGVPAARIAVLNPGVALPATSARSAGARGWREANGLAAAPVLLSVGRLTARKGLVEFVGEVLPRVLRERPDACLVVIGETPRHALRPGVGGDAAAIMQAARRAGVAARVHLLGAVPDDALLAAYAAADVHVFPVRDLPGDVEGFGMVALEAAAHGLPTVAYAVGGVPDAVDEGRSGWLLPTHDAEGFACRVVDALAPGVRAGLDASCRAFAAAKAWPVFERRLTAILLDEAAE